MTAKILGLNMLYLGKYSSKLAVEVKNNSTNYIKYLKTFK